MTSLVYIRFPLPVCEPLFFRLEFDRLSRGIHQNLPDRFRLKPEWRISAGSPLSGRIRQAKPSSLFSMPFDSGV
jgi:hypothetical protein